MNCDLPTFTPNDNNKTKTEEGSRRKIGKLYANSLFFFDFVRFDVYIY